MICFICNGPTKEFDVRGDLGEKNCPKCGCYQITETALVMMRTHKLRFDVELARHWIAELHRSGITPIIDAPQAARLVDV